MNSLDSTSRYEYKTVSRKSQGKTHSFKGYHSRFLYRQAALAMPLKVLGKAVSFTRW